MKLSVIFGYRNRDTLRVKRCLDSLKVQNFKEFEVVFVNYGSSETFSVEIEELISEYPFVHYFYSDSRDMPWNRSHALNTGVRYAKGEYVLFGDIDLIYSSKVLEALMEIVDDKTQLYSKVYLLEKEFNQWEQLDVIDLNTIIVSTETGRGGVHIVKKSIIESIHGYDEYYSFWGVEDRDLSLRIELLGIETRWNDNEKYPVFHQWHADVSRAKKGFFPHKWWEKMNIHYQLNINTAIRNNEHWGKLIKPEDRLVYTFPEILYTYKPLGDWMQKGRFAVELIELLQNNTDKTIVLHVDKQSRFEKRLQFINTWINKISKSVVIKQDAENYFHAYNDVLFVVWTLIKETNLIRDYAIIDKETEVIIKLVGGKNE